MPPWEKAPKEPATCAGPSKVPQPLLHQLACFAYGLISIESTQTANRARESKLGEQTWCREPNGQGATLL